MNEYNPSKEMPRFPEPYWRDSEHIRSFPPLTESIHVDAVVAGKLDFTVDKAEDLANDEGTVISVNGQRAGAYRDTQGKLHVVDTTCTHMSCELNWNNGERT